MNEKKLNSPKHLCTKKSDNYEIEMEWMQVESWIEAWSIHHGAAKLNVN